MLAIVSAVVQETFHNNLRQKEICLILFLDLIPVKVYLFKVNNWDFEKRYEICSKLAIKSPERIDWRRSGVVIVNFEDISYFFTSVSIVDFEEVNISSDNIICAS